MKKELPDPNPRFVAVDETGAPADMSVLDENNIAHDPTRMTVDLTKDEKRRTTALMMAIQAYSNIIIKDAEYLRVASDRERAGGPVIQPATMNAMVEAAIAFDAYIAGHFSTPVRDEAEEGITHPVKAEAGA
jgi:hypothetical protein